MKRSRSFQKRFKLLKQEEIESIDSLSREFRKINEREQIFSLGCIFNIIDTKNYSLYYITGKFGVLEGCLLELSANLTWKSRFSLVCDFAFCLYEVYSVDSYARILNSLEANQKNVFKKLGIDIETNVVCSDFVHNPSKSALIANKISYIYVMKNNLNGLYKIGYSTQPYKRETTLQSQEPDISLISLRKGTYEVETAIHRKYKDKRVRGEWFNLERQDILDIEKFIINY